MLRHILLIQPFIKACIYVYILVHGCFLKALITPLTHFYCPKMLYTELAKLVIIQIYIKQVSNDVPELDIHVC